MLQLLGTFAQGSDHPGLDFTRLASDVFEIDGPSGRHYCIAAKPQGTNLRTLQETLVNAILPKGLVKSLIHRLLFSVNWLHATCGVVHTGIPNQVIWRSPSTNEVTDISPPNVLTLAMEEINFKHVEEQESQDPSLPIMDDGAPVYKSRTTMLEVSGVPVLADFGKMRLAEPMNKDWWMPDIYRAPEVLLMLPWGFPVDIWSLGVMVSSNAAESEAESFY